MGTEKQGPKKPSASPAGVAFSDTGKVRPIVDPPLPTDKNDLERLIVRHFLATLQSDLGLKVCEPSKPSPPPNWPDFIVTIDSRIVGIELVGAIHYPNAMVRDVRSRYADAVNAQLADVQADLDEYSIVLDDHYQVPAYPRIASREGRQLVGAIIAHIRGEIPHLPTLQAGYTRNRRWRDDPGLPVVTASIRRRPTAARPAVRFNEIYLRDGETVDREVATAISHKLDKDAYRKYAGTLWLLVHSESIVPTAWSPRAMDLAYDTLQSAQDPPFEQVWFADLLPGTERVHAERLHPDCEYTVQI